MFSSAPVFVLVFAFSGVFAIPAARQSPSGVKLPFSRSLSAESGWSLYWRDIQRAQAMRSFTTDDIFEFGTQHPEPIVSTPADNAFDAYLVNVGVGTPPTFYSLIMDTGSSNTWVGAKNPYVKTKTSVNTTDAVFVPYGSGSFNGTEFFDTVTLDEALVICKQSIGVANSTVGVDDADGILGLGPQILTKQSLIDHPTRTIPTVTDNLFAARTIPSPLIGISLSSANNGLKDSGEITWGGIDEDKIIGPITYIPVTKTKPSSYYWGVDAIIDYGSESLLPLTSGIVDTGTTLLLLATDAFERYGNLTGAVMDKDVGFLSLTKENFSKLETMPLSLGNTTFLLTPNAQVWPTKFNSVIGGKPDMYYLIIGDNQGKSGSGFDFTLGKAFLERFYSVYDTEGQRVGIANTPHTWD